MGNWISKDSYLDKHACSARNITWQYIHTGNGSLPTAYADCPGSRAILNSHCCQKGRCYPTYLVDMEFERYEWNDWDGLGSPYMPGEKTSSHSWLLCKVILGEDERHAHIIGVDGKPVKNESAILTNGEVDIKGNPLRERGLMSAPDMSQHYSLANPDHQTSHRMIGNNSDTIVSSPSPAKAQKPITWTDRYQSQTNDGTKNGILVAGIITVSVIGLICLLVRNPLVHRLLKILN
jgi:hypothetical protein